MPGLSQETMAIIGASVGLAALILTSIVGLRGEVRAVRTEMRAEIRDVRAETRADREAFERHIIRLTEQQGILAGNIESVRNQLATTQ